VAGRQDRFRLPLTLCVTALFTAITAGFLTLIWQATVLRLDGVTTTAEVVETFERHRGRRSAGSSYRVRYRFRADGSDRWYGYDRVMLKGEPAAPVTRPVWEQARATGRIQVVYRRSDPTLNRPADAAPLDGILCPSLAAAITGAFALLWWFLLADDVLGRIRRSRKAAHAAAIIRGCAAPAYHARGDPPVAP
jgi:hypothetical protein